MARLTNFMDPFANFHDSGWQPAHGFFALAQGAVGVGIGASTEKWRGLPEAHTDFIFAVIGEELGLFGTLIVLGLFARWRTRGSGSGYAPRTCFVRYAAAGHHHLAAGTGDDQHRHGPRPVAGHRDPAAAGVLRWIGIAADADLAGTVLAFAKTEPGARTALRSRRRGWRARLASSLGRARAHRGG
jgi:cell division protein FtsW